MSRTPLHDLLQKALRTATREDHTDIVPSRRDFLRTAGLAGAAITLPSWLSACRRPQDVPISHHHRVVIVGAGIAGLHAAWILRHKGVAATVFEGSARTGGRIMTSTNFLVRDSWTELGGEYIDSTHTDMLALADKFELERLDLSTPDFGQYDDVYFFEGRRYTQSDIVAALLPVLPEIRKHVSMLPHDYRQLANSPSAAFDTMSLEAYFTSLGLTGWIRSFLDSAFITENGLEPGEQSALNFLALVDTDVSGGVFRQYGDSDERFKIRGGNQRITDRLSADLGPQIRTGHRLEAMKKTSTGYRLTFRKDQHVLDIDADHVLLTVPWTILRTIDLDIDLPADKQHMIQNLSYGSNAKIMVGFGEPFWHSSGDNGFVYSDSELQLVWDNTALQGAKGAGLTFYTGGSMCRLLGALTTKDAAERVLAELPAIWPQSSQVEPGRIQRMQWTGYPWIKASYSTYGPGQWTSYYGKEFTSVGNVHFAGEHCSERFRGYMNGAAETGRRAATNILAAIGAHVGA